MSIPTNPTTGERPFTRLAVVGAGNMGSGIAQKMATEGYDVVLVDVDDDKVARGLAIIERTLTDGVERGIFKADAAAAILARVKGTSRFEDLADADLVVEAVFEDFDVKKRVFQRLDEVCPPPAILATNTSSFSVTELAATTQHPARVIGLHYFFHPAKNRLVEVVGGKASDPALLKRAWRLQEALGKTPIASTDTYGFIVNRFFLPWLTEAVRMLDEGVADAATIDEGAKKAFGIGMGPFELMNVTGVPIALHAATTFGRAFGPLYAPPARLRVQAESGQPWDIRGTADPARFAEIADRMSAAVFYVAAALVDEKVGTIEDTDIGARVGLRWRRGPFEMMNHVGIERASNLVTRYAERWKVPVPAIVRAQAGAGTPFRFSLVRSETSAGICTITINRPDAMNALNEEVLAQLEAAFAAAADDAAVKGIVIAGSGKAFVAGADIRFFVRNIEAGHIDRIAAFTERGQALLRSIETCAKPVVARVHGLALGGGVELALACHTIVATAKATLAFPETGIGIYPGLGGTQRTTRRVGTGLAKWLILTGQAIDAKEALAIGLVDKVVPYENLDAAIAETIAAGRSAELPPRPASAEHRPLEEFFNRHDSATLLAGTAPTSGDTRLEKAQRRVAGKAPIALRLAADLIDRSAGLSIDEGLALELSHLHEIFATKDAYEGLTSVGRRPAVFKGQ
ncbi:MAG TPA: 3-hydroxyacyl-CoA dehydrogenase NAD-binding domain-containing protein [Vicinamibacterales bacterium]|nr:3-hydroxyacyl-CoA dehydrogenase NAD-binding domain-containing protein [Vicinamibacterales bacterium]